MNWKKRLCKIGETLLYITTVGSLLFSLYVLARMYLFASCVIPTTSMSPTLQSGDYLIASLRIPGCREYEEDEEGNIIVHRKKGAREVRKNDIVIFNFPYSEDKRHMKLSSKTFYCKRCVALPGEEYHWRWKNKQHQIYLPKAGDELPMDSTNYKDYRKCIEYETHRSLRLRGDTVLLEDSVIRSYRFRLNYYFMRGDNWKHSYDSRFWGLLPEDFIFAVGKFIWFSKQPDTYNIRWRRIGKGL